MQSVIIFFSIFCLFIGNDIHASDSPSSTNGGNGDVVAQFQVNNSPANITCYAGPPGSAVAFNGGQSNFNGSRNNNFYNSNSNNNGGNYNNGGGNYNNNGGNYNNGGGNYNNNGGNYNNSGQNGFNGSAGNNNNSVNGGTQTVLMPVRVPKGMAQQFSGSTAGSNGGGQVCSCPSVTPAQSVPVMPAAQGGVSYMPGMPTMMGGMIPGGGMMPGGMMGGMVPGMSGGMMMPGYGGGMPGFTPAAGMGNILSSLFGGIGSSGSMNFGGQGGNFAMGGGGISSDFQQTIQRIFSAGSGGSGSGGSFGGGMNFGGQGADQYNDGNGYVCRKESGIGSMINNFLPRGMR